MNAEIVQVRGITFIGKGGSGHWALMDGSSKFLGSEGASSPKELVLIGLGGCTGADVGSILHKMREKVERFELYLDADTETEHPKAFTKIHITYKFWGNGLKKENIEKAISLSLDKYCSVSAMLKKSVPITYSYKINPESKNGPEENRTTP
jgi:putative redox protein